MLVKDNRIIAQGYNGHIAGCKHESHCRDGHEIGTVHAEQNGIVQAARRGVSLDKSQLYSNYGPCTVCAKMLVNLGVRKVFIKEEYHDDEGISILREGGIDVINWTE